jgi:hypothetical protein
MERLPKCAMQMSEVRCHALHLADIRFAEQRRNLNVVHCQRVRENLIAKILVRIPVGIAVSLNEIGDSAKVARDGNAGFAHVLPETANISTKNQRLTTSEASA